MINKIMVHAGIFHMDDVMCVAMMKLLIPSIQVERVNKVPESIPAGTIVADIGLGKYDHHQHDAKLRNDGMKRAACGLLFEDFGDLLFPSKISRDKFETEFIIPIEDQDNGGYRNPLSIAVKSMNPSWMSDKDENEAFNEAVDFVLSIVENEIKRAEAEVEAGKEAKDIIKNADDIRLVVLDRYLPISSILSDAGCMYMIFPSKRGGFCVNSMKNKTLLPYQWMNNPPEGLIFIHTEAFTSTFDTLEHAINAGKGLLQCDIG